MRMYTISLRSYVLLGLGFVAQEIRGERMWELDEWFHMVHGIDGY